MLEYTRYHAGVEFESPLVYELIGPSFFCSELDFNQEHGWIFNLASSVLRETA